MFASVLLQGCARVTVCMREGRVTGFGGETNHSFGEFPMMPMGMQRETRSFHNCRVNLRVNASSGKGDG